ncbi:MAG: histidine phosphatase family protein [Fibrobacteria bacterium]|nr:histidine phosphatase family protein [Fibrobacteria bacterium]
MAKKLILIRHGEVAEKYQGRFIGSTDAPLSTDGELQLKKFRPYIKTLKETKFYYSPLLRAMDSCRLAMEGRFEEAESEDLLREVNFGEWENLKYTEIQKQFPEVYDVWSREWSLDFAYPNGESHRELVERVTVFGEKARAMDCENVVAFTHGAVIMFMVSILLGLDSGNYRLFSMKRGSRTRLDISYKPGVLLELNCLNP